MGQLRESKDLYVEYNKPLTIVKTIFLCWGFITVVNPFLINELAVGIGFDKEEEKILQYVFYASYFVFGLPAGFLTKYFGFKHSLMYGLATAAASVFFMVTGARSASFELILGGMIMQGAGFSILQVSANPYIILIGKPGEGASRLSMAGAFNSFGTWLAPLMGSLIATAGIPENLTLAQDIQDFKTELVVLPYVLITVVFVGMIVLVNFSDMPEIKNIDDIDTNVKDDKNTNVLQYKHLILGFFAIFFYVGAEVAVGSNLYDFIKVHIEDASLASSIYFIIPYYWGGAMVGRFVGAGILKDTHPAKALLTASLIAGLLLIIAIFTPSQGAMFAILAIGLFNSIMWPCIFELGIHGLGRFTPIASSILIMGIIGGAAVSYAVNYINFELEKGLNIALLIPVVCYLYIAYYAASGHKYNQKENY